MADAERPFAAAATADGPCRQGRPNPSRSCRTDGADPGAMAHHGAIVAGASGNAGGGEMVRLACDVGGSFTDLVVADGAALRLCKAPTTPADPAAGVLSPTLAGAPWPSIYHPYGW